MIRGKISLSMKEIQIRKPGTRQTPIKAFNVFPGEYSSYSPSKVSKMTGNIVASDKGDGKVTALLS